jgi:methylated-DNA-[protein]-cysteine S-methyltransferase
MPGVGCASHNGGMRSLRWAVVQAPFGPVSVGCSDLGVAGVRFGPPPAGAGHSAARAGDPAAEAGAPGAGAGDPVLAAAMDQVAGYFAGTRTAFDVPLDWTGCSGVRLAVLTLLAGSVPFGETISYGSLARRLAERDGRPDVGARAIGGFMGSNPLPLIVPCHRVVASDGLGGFSGGYGVELKRWLLTFEGALPAMLDFGAPLMPS